MNKYSFFFENENLLTQFVAAFDDTFLYRYDKNRIAKEKIKVRYVFGPKQRVLYDIVNQAKNITLPVISMEQKNIKRDSSRIQFKDQKMIRPHKGDRTLSRIPSPVPVTCDVDVSIVANYKADIDQIVANFIPWCNPYFIISWKIPDEFELDFTDELRTEVTWGGSVDFENPVNMENTDKYRIIGNTSFNLKGWMFPSLETPQAPIYVVRTNFTAVSSGTTLNGYDSYWSLSAQDTTDVVLVSAYPEFTNSFYNGLPYHDDLEISSDNDHVFGFYGKRFGFNNSWYLSGQPVSSLVLEEIHTAKYPVVSGFRIPDSFVTTVNDNIVAISLKSPVLSSGNFTFVTANSAGWGISDFNVMVI